MTSLSQVLNLGTFTLLFMIFMILGEYFFHSWLNCPHIFRLSVALLVSHVIASSAPASLRQVRQEGRGTGQQRTLTEVLGYIYGADTFLEIF